MKALPKVRRLLLLAFVASLGVGTAPPRPAVAESQERGLGVEFEDGAQAPAYGWSQDDGCPARTGASAAKALRGPLERAWKVATQEGPIEGEPLAWKDRVFVVERGPKRRVLRALLAATGADRGRVIVDATAPLFPSVGEGRILLRTSPTVVEAFSVGDTMLSRRWKIVAKEGIGAATMLRDEVYVVRDGVLERWKFGTAAPTWPKNADRSDGVKVERDRIAAGAAATPPRYPRPSLRGPSVFVTSGHDLIEVDRASGAEKGRVVFEGDVDPEQSRIVVGSGEVFVRRGLPATAEAADTLDFSRSSPGSMEARLGLTLPSGLATVGAAWVGVVETDGTRRLSGTRASGDAFEFAGEGLHDEFVAPVPPTYVPGTVYVGLRAFAVPSLNVLRASAPAVLSRAIPLRDRVIVVESPTTVSAWRETHVGEDRLLVRPPGLAAAPAADPKGAGAPAGTGPSSAPVALKGCKAVLDDGRVLEGPFTYDPKANAFRSTKPGELPSCPARAVQAVLTNDAPRRVVLAFRAQEAAAGVATILRSETAKAILALVPAAVAAGDAELARRVLASAVERGAADAEVGAADALVSALEASPHPKDDAKAAEVETQFAALERREADALVEVADAMPKDAPGEVAVALVKEAVERVPRHEGAAKWVRAHLPKELPVTEPLVLDDWLDFISVRQRLKVRVWGVNKETREPWGSDGYVPSQDSRLFNDFWAARSMWPGDVDVVAFECGPLVVFSPLERPGAIVKCLALGRLVSDTLDQSFSPMGPPKKESENLILHLYSNRDQYLEASRPSGEAERHDGLENTAGHYSPGENVTRMFFPDDEEADEVPGVYAHELTHHWIERRRPGTEAGDRSSATPGYFVVEGFADFVRGFVFDVSARKANPENPRADYADVLSGIAPESLIPWPRLLTMTQKEFHDLSFDDRIPVARRWRLGPLSATVPMVLFYDQASATCAYLWLAENGKYRKALLDFVYAYYGGKAQADTLAKSTGLAPEDLGKRVVAWCHELVKKG